MNIATAIPDFNATVVDHARKDFLKRHSRTVWCSRSFGRSITFSFVTACAFALGAASLLHRFELDPRIAAGPITLALADFFALVSYFTGASLVLR